MTDDITRPEGEPGVKKKITLPSSGLAEDILGELGIEVNRETGSEEEAEVSSFSFEEMYGFGQGEEKEESLHLVGFMLAGEEYAFDISQVQEIIRVGDWTRVPNAPGHIIGVINLRGRIIPVVDPKVRMGMAGSGRTASSRIMIVEAGRKVLGLLVDSVSQVLRVPTRLVEDAPDEISDDDKDFIRGVGKLEGRLVTLLELHRLVGLKAEAA
jgi:purine-binding chemotaxis protein CheW